MASEHMPLALKYANERAERWKQRYDTLRYVLARAHEHREHCTANDCCLEVLDGRPE